LDDREKYVQWYRTAQTILGDLAPSGLTSAEIIEKVSPNDWLIIPTNDESTRQQAIQRANPNIYFSLNGTTWIGLVCNTLTSIRKMANILTNFHSEDQEKFLAELRKLDSTFRTAVSRKIYKYYWGESPTYETVFERSSNTMTTDAFERIFSTADTIHSEGRQMKDYGGKYSRLLPHVTLAETSFPTRNTTFQEKLRSLVPLYEISLGIRTSSQLRKEYSKDPVGQKGECPKCGFQIPLKITRVCPKCQTSLKPI